MKLLRISYKGDAGMAELADAADLKSADLGHEGSIPSLGTKLKGELKWQTIIDLALLIG